MWFYLPVRVYQEKDCVQKHGEELASLGKKALIVTGKHSSRKNGSLQDVENALKKYRNEYTIFDDIEENPSVETVMRARDYGIQNGADYVIGIGGGSPLDAAKAIALMMKNADRDETLLCSREVASALPVAAVPTTCGTGSEVTPYAILTVHAKRTKASISHRIFPQLALIDGTYLSSASLDIIANTAVDALGHFIESYCNNNATDYSRMLCTYGLEVWARSRDILLGDRKGTCEDYQNLMCASAIAGMAISHTGTSLPHGMSYKITYEKGIPHGKAVGIFQAAYLHYADQADQSAVLNRIGMNSCKELGEMITRVVGTVALDEAFIQEAVLQMIANQRKLANCPYPIDTEKMKQLYIESCR